MAADGLVVPGVGAYEACMTGLRKIGGEKIIADRLKKLDGVSEDEKSRAEKDVQKVHDDFMAKIEDAVKAKEAEIMEV